MILQPHISYLIPDTSYPIPDTRYPTALLAVLACLFMASSFAADKQTQVKKSPNECNKKMKNKEPADQSIPIPAFYVLQQWRT